MDQLCKADTDTVLKISTCFMEALKCKQLNEAVKMLYTVNGLQLDTLSNQERQHFLRKFEVLPINSYKMDYYSFSTQGNNDVSFIINICEYVIVFYHPHVVVKFSTV